MFLIPVFPFAKFLPYLEVRERFERRINPAFTTKPDGNRSDLYQRIRTGVEFQLDTHFAGTLEYQYLNDLYWTQALNANSRNSDLSQGYVRYKGPESSLNLGRQRIGIGDERLFGVSNWQTLGRSWDSARFDYGPFDIWFGKLGVANTKPESARAGGVSINSPTGGIVSFLVKHDSGVAGPTNLETIDYQYVKELGSFTFQGDLAGQLGTLGPKVQEAYAYHLSGTEKVNKKVKLTAEYDVASGGGSQKFSQTFDNLYPTSHDLFELADIVTWKNIDHYRVLLDTQFSPKLSARMEYSVNASITFRCLVLHLRGDHGRGQRDKVCRSDGKERTDDRG